MKFKVEFKDLGEVPIILKLIFHKGFKEVKIIRSAVKT